jgi:hypothetical protein
MNLISMSGPTGRLRAALVGAVAGLLALAASPALAANGSTTPTG